MALPHALDLFAQHVVAPRTHRTPRRVHLPCAIPVGSGRRDRQDAADRLDTVHLARFVNERVPQRVRRPSSLRGRPPATKNALALPKISLARFSSRCSHSSAARRVSSRRVRPCRSPVSPSAFSSQRRRVSFVHPSVGAIAEIAAHWEGWHRNCSRTSLTARSRASELNRNTLDFAMTPSSHKVESPVMRGRFRRPLRRRGNGVLGCRHRNRYCRHRFRLRRAHGRVHIRTWSGGRCRGVRVEGLSVQTGAQQLSEVQSQKHELVQSPLVKILAANCRRVLLTIQRQIQRSYEFR